MKRANRLINEKSPYLLQHAYNPVDWYPWSSEAFDRAKRESKPIFLSVGYSTCHWCHVMERESFENQEIANVMNDLFVNVKVDRECMPDVDKAYMTFVQATTRSGGWPMSVWLTPDLKPIFGGTYFPPVNTSGYGRPSFMTVCRTIGERWARDKEKLVRSATEIMRELQEAVDVASDLNDKVPGWEIVDRAHDHFKRAFDQAEGGFSDEPKFPTPVVMNFLATYYWTNRLKPGDIDEVEQMSSVDDLRGKMKELDIGSGGGNGNGRVQSPDSMKTLAVKFMKDRVKKSEDALTMTLHTLRKMYMGGIHDHVGHGFHRYSTDNRWHVPHFEKMLYDQAQLMTIYGNAFKITKEPLFKEAVEDTFDYCRSNLANADGGFFSAEDADSLPLDSKDEHHAEKKEGAFAVWTHDQVQQTLGQEDSKWFCDLYGVKDDAGNVDPRKDIQGELKGQNVLIQTKSFAAKASELGISEEELKVRVRAALSKLYEERKKRPKPHLDDKIITSWNGLMLTGLCTAYQAVRSQSALQYAVKTAEFMKRNLYSEHENKLHRSYKEGHCFGNPICDDYAFLIQGLLDLYQTTFDEQWLKWAYNLQKKQDELFWHSGRGGYFGSSKESNAILRFKDDHDGAEPSANSISLKNLVRFSHLIEGDGDFDDKARHLISAFHDRICEYPQAVPQMIESFILFKKRPIRIVLTGALEDETTRVFTEELQKQYLPTAMTTWYGGGKENNGFLYDKSVSARQMIDETPVARPSAHICKNFTCGPKIEDVHELLHQLGVSTD